MRHLSTFNDLGNASATYCVILKHFQVLSLTHGRNGVYTEPNLAAKHIGSAKMSGDVGFKIKPKRPF